jgi:hypothetical protein
MAELGCGRSGQALRKAALPEDSLGPAILVDLRIRGHDRDRTTCLSPTRAGRPGRNGRPRRAGRGQREEVRL